MAYINNKYEYEEGNQEENNMENKENNIDGKNGL